MAGYRNRGMAKRPINSTKNVVDASGALVALTDTIIITPVKGVAANQVTTGELNNVVRGAKVNGIYLSLFFAADTNAAAAEVPLLDWYIIYNKNGMINSTSFSGTDPQVYPTAGGMGNNTNRSAVLHQEKGLIGEKNDGSKMVFTGVIRIPRGMQRIGEKTTIDVVARANQTGVFCAQSIYKWYE